MFLWPACLLLVLRVVATSPLPSNTLNTYLPRLPVGEYRIIYEAMYPCENTKNHQIACNFYFSKKSRNVTEIRGNVTLKIPGDDRLNFELNMSSWGSTGGWVQNTFVYRSDKFCSGAKKLLGKTWIKVFEAGNLTTRECPIPMGTFTSSGLNVRHFDDHTLPKIYFYGKYKLVLYIRNVNDALIGCLAMEVRLVRPWEEPGN